MQTPNLTTLTRQVLGYSRDIRCVAILADDALVVEFNEQTMVSNEPGSSVPGAMESAIRAQVQRHDLADQGRFRQFLIRQESGYHWISAIPNGHLFIWLEPDAKLLDFENVLRVFHGTRSVRTKSGLAKRKIWREF